MTCSTPLDFDLELESDAHAAHNKEAYTCRRKRCTTPDIHSSEVVGRASNRTGNRRAD